ncbi:MAG: hypothetical protein IH935_04695, partial [Acidobacteria bacterium]|nr:hypothetical protein [Acidobacteriota bacterium]
SFHRGGLGAERRQTLDIVEEEGVDLGRVILGHADEIANDLPLMVELLERGVYIQFDLIGREEALTESLTALDARAVPRKSKLLAGASLFFWIGAITAGRLLAYTATRFMAYD